MLVSGVWRLWLTPAQEVVLGRVELEQLRGSAPRRVANSWALRMAAAISLANSSSRSWSARSQRRVAGRRPMSTPRSSPPARRTARSGRDTPGTTSSSSTIAGVAHDDRRVDQRERRRRVVGRSGRRGPRRRRAARPRRWPRGCRPSSRLRRSRSAASRLWLSARRASSSSPDDLRSASARSPVETRSTADAIERSGASEVARPARTTSRSRRPTMIARRTAGRGPAGVGRSGRRTPGRARARRRRRRPAARSRRDEGERSAGCGSRGAAPSGSTAGAPSRRAVAAPVIGPVGRSRPVGRASAGARAGSRRRGPSGGGPAGSGRPRPSGAAGAS